MRQVTLCMAYYLNAGMLRVQYERLRSLPEELQRHISVVIVDDGSPQDPAWVEPLGGIALLRLYRIGVDIRWNQDAARNIAVRHAPAPWVLLTDMDHLVPLATWRRLIGGELDGKAVYKFGRVNFPGGDPYKQHPNTWLMTRKKYDQVGGYDERFAGHYGTDGDFASRIAKSSTLLHLSEAVERVPREVIPDASTTTYARKDDRDRSAIIEIKARRAREADPRPLRYCFPYLLVEQWPAA